MRDPEPDSSHVLTEQDALMFGISLAEAKAQTAWTVEPHEVPAELTPEFEAVTYTDPPVRTWATVSDRLDSVMRDRLTEWAKGIV